MFLSYALCSLLSDEQSDRVRCPAICMAEQGVFTRFHAYNFEKDVRFQSGLDRVKEQHHHDNDPSWLIRTKLFYYNKFIEPISISDYFKAMESGFKFTDEESTSTATSAEECYLTEELSSCSLSSDNDSSGRMIVTVDCATSSVATSSLAPHNDHCKDITENASNISEDVAAVVNICEQEQRESQGASSAVSSDAVASIEYQACSGPKTQGQASLTESQEFTDFDRSTADVHMVPPGQEEHRQKEHLTLAQIVDYIERGETLPDLKELDIKPTNLEPTKSSVCKKAKPWEKNNAQ